MLLKDNCDTYDMPATGASLALRGAVPAYDAFQVGKLRDAGTVLVGKVNLHEFALGLTTHGSSGGSAIAVTANFAAFGMGTDRNWRCTPERSSLPVQSSTLMLTD